MIPLNRYIRRVGNNHEYLIFLCFVGVRMFAFKREENAKKFARTMRNRMGEKKFIKLKAKYVPRSEYISLLNWYGVTKY